MLNVTWTAAHNPVLTSVNIEGYLWCYLWDIPTESPGDWIASHRLGVDGTPKRGAFQVQDDNVMEWGPSVAPDNWCSQLAIEGSYELDLSRDQLDPSIITYDQWGNPLIQIGWANCFVNSTWEVHPRWDYTLKGERIGDLSFTITQTTYTGYVSMYAKVDIIPFNGYYQRHIERYYGGYGPYVTDDTVGNLDTGWRGVELQPIYPEHYRARYQNLASYVKRYAEANIWPKLRYDIDEWDSCLEAVDGYHPYDLNLVESFCQFSMEDVVPKGTSEKNLSLLTDAVNSKGGLASPSGLLAGSQIFANSYLYYKYVASGDYSDVTQIMIGDDKAFMGDVCTQIFSNDPNYKPSYENWRLKRIAETIVHRGSKAITSYGTKDTHKITDLGDLSSLTRSRLTAWPRYYDDMSTAAIVCEEFGLALTPKRLVETIPYEFIAQWILPIEETIHSIEMNSSRLNSMYKIKNLCISRKDLLSLNDNALRPLFGLSLATGHLTLKRYNRRSQLTFPPTALDLSLRPQISLSRVMQGSSLIISRL